MAAGQESRAMQQDAASGFAGRSRAPSDPRSGSLRQEKVRSLVLCVQGMLERADVVALTSPFFFP